MARKTGQRQQYLVFHQFSHRQRIVIRRQPFRGVLRRDDAEQDIDVHSQPERLQASLTHQLDFAAYVAVHAPYALVIDTETQVEARGSIAIRYHRAEARHFPKRHLTRQLLAGVGITNGIDMVRQVARHKRAIIYSVLRSVKGGPAKTL